MLKRKIWGATKVFVDALFIAVGIFVFVGMVFRAFGHLTLDERIAIEMVNLFVVAVAVVPGLVWTFVRTIMVDTEIEWEEQEKEKARIEYLEKRFEELG
jgi:hypothetical protein